MHNASPFLILILENLFFFELNYYEKINAHLYFLSLLNIYFTFCVTL